VFALSHVNEGLVSKSNSVGDGCNYNLTTNYKVENLYSGIMTEHTNYLKKHEKTLLPVREEYD